MWWRARPIIGDHRSACSTSGFLRSRAVPLERIWARVCREAGATVRTNVPLQHMNLDVPTDDGRQIEILAQGLPLHHGAHLAIDATLVSPLGAPAKCATLQTAGPALQSLPLRAAKGRPPTPSLWPPVVAAS